MRSINKPSNVKGFLTASLMASTAWMAMLSVADATTIRESIRAAVETNPEVEVVAADRRAVDQELRQARGGLLPSVDVRAAAGGEYTDSPTTRNTEDGDNSLLRNEAQLTLTQMLFDGFETESEINRQRSRIDSAAYRVEEAAEFVALDAVEAHLDVLRNEAIVVLNQANIAAHERILAQVQDLADSGAGDIADVRQTQARLATARENLAVSQGSLADAEAAYINVVGDAPVDLQLGTPPVAALPADREAAAALASTNSPTVKIAAADVDVSAAEARGARAGFYPRFDLELNGSAADDVDGVKGSDYGASALVVMRYNLYRGGADLAREREAFHRTNESRAALRQIRRASEQQARVSYNALDTARARTEALQQRVEAQRRTRDAYRSQFEIGQRDLLDVLDSENELLLARVALTTAEFTERFAVYRVLSVVGTLIDTVGLEKPRETISILRTPDDVQTPERVEEKSLEVIEPRSEPRPVRGELSGEPPIDTLDAADEINQSAVSLDQPVLADTVPEESLQLDTASLGEDEGFLPAAYVQDTQTSVASTAGVANDTLTRSVGSLIERMFSFGAKAPDAQPLETTAKQKNFAQNRDAGDPKQISTFLDEITISD